MLINIFVWRNDEYDLSIRWYADNHANNGTVIMHTDDQEFN